MDIGNVGFIGLVVITIVGAIKDAVPNKPDGTSPMTGNITRVVALVVGGLLGGLAQAGLLMGVEATIVTGIMAGIAAVGTVTVADRVGINS